MKKLILFLVVLNLITFGQTAEDYFTRGLAKYDLEYYKGAVEDFNKAIQLKPDYADAYFNRGFAKNYLRDYKGAIVDLNKAIQLKPDYADAYTYRGAAKFDLKDTIGACADWSKAGELGSAKALTYFKEFCIQDVRIGNQVWTTKNLDVETYRNRDKIPQVQDKNAWANLKTGAWCYYENKGENGTKYGKLYNWYAVNDPRGLAPNGYHIPTDAEWTILTDYLGGKSIAGAKMKSTSGWIEDGNGTNSSGFSGLPGGSRYTNGDFYEIGAFGYWWSSSEDDPNYAWGHYLGIYNNLMNESRTQAALQVSRMYHFKKNGFYVRCIKD